MASILEFLTKLDGTIIALVMGFIGFNIFKNQREKIREQREEIQERKKKEQIQGKIHREAAKILDKTDKTESDWEGKIEDATRKNTLNAFVDLFNELYNTKPDQFADGLDPTTYKKPKI